MNLSNIYFLLEAAPEAAQAPGMGAMLQMFLPLIIVFVLMYFMTIRPQKKREEELRRQLDAMEVGDQVITIGGITGRVFNIQDDEVTVSTSVQNTLMTFKKSAIAVVIPANPDKAAEKKAESKEDKPNFVEKMLGKKDENEEE